MEADAKAARLFTTPGWTTRAILPRLLPWLPTDRDPIILGPAAGTGAIEREVIKAGIPARCIHVTERNLKRAHRLRAMGLGSVYVGDVLKVPHAGPRADLVLMNPPGELAGAFIDWARAAAGPHGTVAALLLASYAETPDRGTWHRANPSDFYPLERRPSFFEAIDEAEDDDDAGDLAELPKAGAVDQRMWAWFVWGPGVRGSWRVLECEPSERRAKLLAKLPPPAPPVHSAIDAAAERRRLVDASVARMFEPEPG